ncbi:MAG: DNA recombination protein RmuC [Syntrophorhabdus sp. PtaU1.Bin050]|nr:MAG: DNA recombination protein RmuC [Syntrophorhabdus sp. PtaU1.Bin050]
MLTVLYVTLGVLAGGVIAWLLATNRTQRRCTELESRASSAETLCEERGRLVQQKEIETAQLRSELSVEKGLRIEALTKFEESQRNLKEQIERFEAMEAKLGETFKALSLDALKENSGEFLKLAKTTLEAQAAEGRKDLEGKKELIDLNIEAVGKTLSEVQRRIEDVGKTSGEKFTEVATLIKKHEEVTSKLKDTTEHLSQALASSKKRGEWGERMAEDIMRLAGMIEGINYTRQTTLEGSSGRPDYTFLLPNNLRINMDVKFPLDNYLRYLDAGSDHEKRRFKEELLRNTKVMIRQVTGREYINPADNTVDYVIVFIPNEQVYSFINEVEPTIMDEALKQKVILCSPFTLYAVLAVIRQAIENFNLERTASEILKLLVEFSKQWSLYKERFKVMGDRLDAARKEYDILTTTRSNMLERPLRKIEELSRQKDINLDAATSGDEPRLSD